MNEFLLLLHGLLKRPFKPGPFYLIELRKGPNMGLKAKFTFPDVQDPDVVKRFLSYSVNDGAIVTQEVALGTKMLTVVVPIGSKVHAELSDADEAGNRSQPSVLDFLAADVQPPAQPGPMTVEIGEEVHEQ